MTEDRHHDDTSHGFVQVVQRLSREAGPQGLTLGDILDRLDERAFGILMLVLAIPCLIPAVQGVPQVVAVPLLLLAGQVLIGREEPWLPRPLLNRRVPKAWLDRMAGFAVKRMAWLERLSRPRLKRLACGFGERFAAAMIVVAVICILPPITNTVPSLAIALLSVGLIQRDGVFVAAGAVLTTLWAALFAAVAVGLLSGAQWAGNLIGQ
jgi:hypothetical protein